MKNIVQPLLSICIPTYNRAEYLRGALENITSDPEFDQRVEIIISDNASPDNTEEVGIEYSSRYPNIKYFRNETNVRDENFRLAFQRASGKYLKLFNDTLRLNPGSLSKMLTILSKDDNAIPLFVQGSDSHNLNSTIVSNKEELLKQISYYITWIGNFGIWRTNLELISTDKKYTQLLLPQVSWYLNIAQNKSIRIYNNHWYNSVWPQKKGGYNIFHVFTTNYFSILKDYHIKKSRYYIEKYRIFRYFLIQYIYGKIVGKPIGNFDTKGMWQILLRHYKFCPYFYTYIPLYCAKQYLNRVLRK